MVLETLFSVQETSSRVEQAATLPIAVEMADDAVVSLRREEDKLTLAVRRMIEPSRVGLAEGSEVPRLRIHDDEAPERLLAENFISAVSFLSDVPLYLAGRKGEQRCVPEDQKDQDLIARLGADQLFVETGIRYTSRTFPAQADADSVQVLLDRIAGVRLYANASKLTLDVARFRELWRVLESAFGKINNELVELLVKYGPAQEMAFTIGEIKDLFVLRGRASHAQSKAGVHEVMLVEHECARRVGRLQNLVERVLFTKSTWGTPTGDVEELAPLQQYIGPGGDHLVLVKDALRGGE